MPPDPDAVDQGSEAELEDAAAVPAAVDSGRTRVDAGTEREAALGNTEDAAPEASLPIASPIQRASFETAQRLTAEEVEILVDEKSADQVDYFVFSGEAGAFYELRTRPGDFSGDNVLSLYDSERRLLAENDSGSLWPGDAIDARIVIRLPASGDYFVRMEDRVTPPEFFTDAPFTLLYSYLRVRKLTAASEGAVLEQAGVPTAVQFTTDATTGYAYVTLLGVFDAEPDTFTFRGIQTSVLVGHVPLSGTQGNGSTALGGMVRVASPGATPIALAEIDRARGQENIHPPVGADSYQVIISPAAASGANGFYSVDLVMLPDNPNETNDAENDVRAGAQPIAMKGNVRLRGLLRSTLAAGDVDHYRFDAVQGRAIDVSCEGESGGSGVRGLIAELLDGSDTVLASASESSVSNLTIRDFVVPASGTYYLRLSTQASNAAQIEPWTRCAVIVSP